MQLVYSLLRDRRGIQRDTGDVKAHLKAEGRKLEIERRRGSLGQLLAAYVKHLRARGSEGSATDAERIFKSHVIKPFPTLAATRANEITGDDIRQVLARMVKAKIRRQVNKARAYLRAAFAYGGNADHDPRTLARDGVLFAIKGNPASMVPVIREYECTLDRTLTEDELRHFWRGLDKLPTAQAATFRFNLALACQRPKQLLRATWADFDFVQNTLLLKDSKGRGTPRDHLLPLTPYALEQLKPLRELNSEAPGPFSSDGKRSIALETLSHAATGISKALCKTHKLAAFQQRDLRRTAETMLQQLGVDREVRAHLLSHGRTQGVQGKHYERYDFLKEKRAALEKWTRNLERIIEGRKAKVVSIRGQAA